MSLLNSKERKARDRGRKQVKEMAIEDFNRILEETRSHKFGVCDADFVIDVIKAKVKEQLIEQPTE